LSVLLTFAPLIAFFLRKTEGRDELVAFKQTRSSRSRKKNIYLRKLLGTNARTGCIFLMRSVFTFFLLCLLLYVLTVRRFWCVLRLVFAPVFYVRKNDTTSNIARRWRIAYRKCPAGHRPIFPHRNGDPFFLFRKWGSFRRAKRIKNGVCPSIGA